MQVKSDEDNVIKLDQIERQRATPRYWRGMNKKEKINRKKQFNKYKFSRAQLKKEKTQ